MLSTADLDELSDTDDWQYALGTLHGGSPCPLPGTAALSRRLWCGMFLPCF